MSAATEPFSYVERVRFAEIDAMQHMNNVEFLRFYETARIAWMSTVMSDYEPVPRGALSVIFAECHILYRAPAFFGDEIRTAILPTDLRRSSVRLGFEMHRDSDGTLLADGYGVLVGYDYEAGATRPFSDEVRESLTPTLIG